MRLITHAIRTHTHSHTHTYHRANCMSQIHTYTHTHTHTVYISKIWPFGFVCECFVRYAGQTICCTFCLIMSNNRMMAHCPKTWPQKPNCVTLSHTLLLLHEWLMSGFSHQQPLDALITLYLTECMTLKRGAHLKRTQRIYCESPFCFCSQQRRLGATVKGFGSESFSHSKPKFAIPNSKAKI